MKQPWRFYGRRAEMQTIHDFLKTTSAFSAPAIYGRRNVGKTMLMDHIPQQVQRSDDPCQVIMATLETAPDISQIHENISEAIETNAPTVLQGYTPHPDPRRDVKALVRRVLTQGHILVIDEFQRIRRDPVLPSSFQIIIDEFQHMEPPYPDHWHPRLIVMGSEQQRLVEMFKTRSAPMLNRVKKFLGVQPCSFDECLEMASDQGWD